MFKVTAFLNSFKDALDSSDKFRIRCSGCYKLVDKEKAKYTGHFPSVNEKAIIEPSVLYWCKESFNDCVKLYVSSLKKKKTLSDIR